MKNLIKHALLGIFLVTAVACKKENKEPPAENLGPFTGGDIQVSASQPTQLGYLSNPRVIITKTGNAATIKISATPNFEREYTGTVTGASQGAYLISLTQQTKPAQKNVAGNATIQNNGAGFDITLNSDAVAAIYNTQNVTVTGDLRMIATSLVKQ
jgi:hypothetical protein